MSNHNGPTPSWLNEAYFEDILKKNWKGTNICVKSIEIEQGSEAGDNYACQIFRIKVNFVKNEKEDSISIIGKLLPETEFADKLTANFDLFNVELRMLSTILPEIYEKYPEAPVFSPVTYSTDALRKILFMEDLRQDGYVSVDKFNRSLDLDHCVLVIKSMATMHAYTYRLMEEKPQVKETFKGSVWKREDGGVVEKIVNWGFSYLLKILDTWPLSEQQKEKLRRQDGNIYKIGYSANEERDDSFCTLLHGDCWVNNMMFRYENGIVKDAKLIDFQTSNYNSIGLDLNYFLFSSVDTYVLENHLDDLFLLYFSTFEDITGKIPGFTVDTVWKEFTDRWGFGLMCSLILKPVIMNVNAFDMDALMNNEECESNNAVYSNDSFVKHVVKVLPFFEDHL